MTPEWQIASAAGRADGVVRTVCAGPRATVVVKRPGVVCKWVREDGVKVRRCA